ncbi:cyclin-dependent kinase inhibitor 1B [Bombina bombina]|uniref:cyclin-dependent kinase inhibitor 1B n=1 Tax=Bombina bombina TaxID=8345 RepID=UPI00235AAAD3|nr:cyclin-dependent kinase inhibitor 1B [Bombina bombina]
MAAFNVAMQEDVLSVLPRSTLVVSGPGRGACRSLFGPIDHDELRSELKRQLKEIQATDCQRWNFDFEAGTPLKGTFSWEPLESKEMPSFYRESRLCPVISVPTPLSTARQAEAKEDSPADAVHRLGNLCSLKENAEKVIRRCQGVKGPSKTSATTTSLHRKRETTTAITDYFPKRKRTLCAKSDTTTTTTKSTFPLCTLEQTPRKKIR